MITMNTRGETSWGRNGLVPKMSGYPLVNKQSGDAQYTVQKYLQVFSLKQQK